MNATPRREDKPGVENEHSIDPVVVSEVRAVTLPADRQVDLRCR